LLIASALVYKYFDLLPSETNLGHTQLQHNEAKSVAMADGMCGPSNPLQNFQKQSTIDRTLQQDRLVSRASPSQVSFTLAQIGQ